jgi:hypothetical protein
VTYNKTGSFIAVNKWMRLYYGLQKASTFSIDIWKMLPVVVFLIWSVGYCS